MSALSRKYSFKNPSVPTDLLCLRAFITSFTSKTVIFLSNSSKSGSVSLKLVCSQKVSEAS